MLYQLSYEATHWERGRYIKFISPVRNEMMLSIIWNNSYLNCSCRWKWSPDFFQASSFQLLKFKNLLRWSFFTFIYNRSLNMNYFIYTSHKQVSVIYNSPFSWERCTKCDKTISLTGVVKLFQFSHNTALSKQFKVVRVSPEKEIWNTVCSRRIKKGADTQTYREVDIRGPHPLLKGRLIRNIL